MRKKLNIKIEELDTLHLRVSNVLRNAILKGDFEPGERLIQEELANALGVSRMPVREALRKLESEGLVKLVPHRGAVVKTFNVHDVKEIYQLRSTLEKMAVEESVPNMKDDDILELERLVKEMNKINEPDEFVEANIEFHRLLMKYCDWSRLMSFIETLWNGFPQQTPTMLPGQLEISNIEHMKIFEAVKEKNAKKSADLIYKHISRTGKQLIESIKARENSDIQ